MEDKQITKKQILGTIYNCKKVLETGTDNVIQLFESEKLFGNDNIDNYNLINFDKVNTYAYLSNVKSLLENTEIHENPEILHNAELQNFFIVLSKKINDLQNTNELDKFDLLNETSKKTKLFARTPLQVLGFNIFDIDKVLDNEVQSKIKYIVLNKTEKQFIILVDEQIYIYDIKTGLFDTYNSLKPDYCDPINISVKYEHFLQTVKEYITNNILILFNNNEKLKYSDNVYNDVSIMNNINLQINQVNKYNSVIK